MAEAAASARDAAAAGGEAVGRDGRMNNVARTNAAALLKAAVRARRRAGAEFGEAASHARSSAAEWDMAADAHAMVGDADSERSFRGLAGRAREMMQDADKQASLAGRDAEAALLSHGRMAGADGWADGAVWPGGRAAWAGAQESMQADAEYDRARWSGAEKRAAEAVQRAADRMYRCAHMANRATAAAKEVAVQATTPDASDAKAAWNEALAAARNAPKACRPRA